jgi:hypothetical protein
MVGIGQADSVFVGFRSGATGGSGGNRHITLKGRLHETRQSWRIRAIVARFPESASCPRDNLCTTRPSGDIPRDLSWPVRLIRAETSQPNLAATAGVRNESLAATVVEISSSANNVGLSHHAVAKNSE